MKILRYIIDILGIMVLVWGLMLALLFFVNKVVEEVELPIYGFIGSLLNNFIQLAISGVMFLAWLFLWYKLTDYCRRRRLKLWSKDLQGQQ
ncbi:MAG: hypothetical protein QW701_03475 [Candidatus Nezhaarchaeales archaeon]